MITSPLFNVLILFSNLDSTSKDVNRLCVVEVWWPQMRGMSFSY